MESSCDFPCPPLRKRVAKDYDGVKMHKDDIIYEGQDEVPFSLIKSSSQVQFGLCSLSKVGWASLDTDQRNEDKENDEVYFGEDELIRYNWLLETCDEPAIEGF